MDELQLQPWWSCSVVAGVAVDVFQSYRNTLNDAITNDDILRLANALYSKGIISRENLDHALLTGVVATKKKVHLFDAIEARIRSHSSDFLTVLDILYGDSVHRDITMRIWESYEEEDLTKHCKEHSREYDLSVDARTTSLKQQLSLLKGEVAKIRSEINTKIQPVVDSVLRAETTIQQLQEGFGEMALLVQTLQATSYRGIFIWKIPEVRRMRSEARSGRRVSLYSAPFYTNRHGYKHVEMLLHKLYEKSGQESAASSGEERKQSFLSQIRKGVRKLFGAARDMTSSFIKGALSVFKLDVKIFRKYKKRFDKHTKSEQVRWWFEIWGDESALKCLESKWEEVSADNKWRLETCCQRF